MPGSGGSDSMSPDAVSAAISAVRQQMCNMVAAAQHQQHPDAATNMIGGFSLPGHLSVHPHSGASPGGQGGSSSMPKLGSPANLNPINNNGGAIGIPVPRLGSPAVSQQHHLINMHAPPTTSNNNNNNPCSSSSSGSTTIVTSSQHSSHPITTGALSITRISSPAPHDLRMTTPEDSPSESPVSMVLEPAVNLAIGGESFKSSKSFSGSPPHQRPASSSPPSRVFKETAIKVEPLTECRGE